MSSLGKISLVVAALVLVASASSASADVFNIGAGLASLETVPVGNPGNAGELSGAGAGGYGADAIVGAVAYEYNIGTYEVTAGQYAEFLNAVAATDSYGLYNSDMWSDTYGCNIKRNGLSGSYSYSVAADWANRPVNVAVRSRVFSFSKGACDSHARANENKDRLVPHNLRTPPRIPPRLPCPTPSAV